MAGKSLKERTAKGLVWGSIGNGAQLVLGLVFGIVLARLLSPADYGMTGILQIFIFMAGTVTDSGFRTALANRPEVRHEDYNAVFWFNVSTAAVLYLILYLCAPLITAFYQKAGPASGHDLSALTPLARFCFAGIVISSIGTAHYAYLFRTLQVRQKATITITSLTLSGLTGITMACMGFSYWSLATQSVMFSLCNTILFWRFSRWRPTLPVSFAPLREMFVFSSKILATGICNCISGNILSVLLGRFYSVTHVGFYNQANKWTTMGSNLIQSTILEVAQPVLHDAADERGRQKRVFRKMLRFTSFLGFPALLGLAFVSREFILITVTGKWLESVPLMQVLCCCSIAFPVGQLCLNLTVARGRSGLVLRNSVLFGLAQIALVCLMHPYGILAMTCAFGCASLLWMLLWMLAVRREIGLRLREAFLDMAPYAACAALSIAVAHLATRAVENLWLLFAAKIAVTAAAYALLMWLSGSAMFRECLSFLRNRGKKPL